MTHGMPKGMLILGLLVFVVPLAVLIVFIACQLATSDDYSGAVTARVVDVEVREEWDDAVESKEEWYYLTAEYQVEGKTYFFQDKRLAKCQVGDTVDLRYDPADPERVRTAADHRVLSNPLSLILYLAAAVLLGLLFWYLNRRAKRLLAKAPA